MNFRQKSRKQFLILASILVALVVLPFAVIGFRQLTIYMVPGYSTSFQEYKPAILPHGLSVKSTSLTVLKKTSPLLLPSYEKILTMSFSNPHIALGQEHQPATFRTDCKTAPTNASCLIITTPAGQRYQLLTHFIDNQNNPTKDSYQTLYWVKGDTYFFLTIDSPALDTYSLQEWSEMIDSMQPYHYHSIPIEHFDKRATGP